MKKRRIFLVVFMAVLGGAGLFFLARPPVVIVTDGAFLELYGQKRADTRRYILSAILFRRVVFAVVSEEAGQDSAELVVNAAAKQPFLALFPERYLEGADRYAAAAGEASLADKTRTVVVDGGEGGGVNIGRAESLRIDRETDLYRAGMCAAILAKDGSVVVYYQDSLSNAYRAMLREGLVAAGYTKTPFFYRYSETASQTDIGCAVLLSAVNVNLLAEQMDVPMILFSWLDPEYTPNGVTVVFDDSLPAVAGQAAKNAAPLTAQARVLTKRVRVGSDLKALQAAVRAERPLSSTGEGS
ncbi:MAG: hypothetical protein LBG27_04565 [Spirochaetaceae bacterium]|jgi:hypothetical protein|nr:hypothetical protein [Spirochaetaceae bacterium]